MGSRPESDEALMRRMLPTYNRNVAERRAAWNDRQMAAAKEAVLKFIQYHNNTGEPDEDILQDSLLIAFLEVERGRYERREGIPFTAYLKGIARNKIREARRRERNLIHLEDAAGLAADPHPRHLERAVERNEQERAFYRGLSELPAQRRAVLECYIHGESTTEIAHWLSISKELVRQHKCRGLRALRQLSDSKQAR